MLTSTSDRYDGGFGLSPCISASPGASRMNRTRWLGVSETDAAVTPVRFLNGTKHPPPCLSLETVQMRVLSSRGLGPETEVIAMALCTECEAEISLDGATEIGEIIQCPDCGLDLEVLSLDPPEVAPAPEEEEDWGE